MKLDSIFKALGVETMEDINHLGNFFITKDSQNDSEKLIDPNEAIRAIRKFMESQKTVQKEGENYKATPENDEERYSKIK